MLSDPREKFIREQPKRQSAETATETQRKNWSKAGIEWIARLLLIASQKRTDPQEVISEIAQPPSETLLLEASSLTLETPVNEFTSEVEMLRDQIGLENITQQTLVSQRIQQREAFVEQLMDQEKSKSRIDYSPDTGMIPQYNLRYRELIGATPITTRTKLMFERTKVSASYSSSHVVNPEQIIDLLLLDALRDGSLSSIRVASLRSHNPHVHDQAFDSFVQNSERIMQKAKSPEVVEKCKIIGDVPKVITRIQQFGLRINATLLLESSGFSTPEDLDLLSQLNRLSDSDYQQFADLLNQCSFLFGRSDSEFDLFETTKIIISWVISKGEITSEEREVLLAASRLHTVSRGQSMAISDKHPEAILASRERVLDEDTITTQLGSELIALGQVSDDGNVVIKGAELSQVMANLAQTGELHQLADLIRFGYAIGGQTTKRWTEQDYFNHRETMDQLEGIKANLRSLSSESQVSSKTLFYEQLKSLIDPNKQPLSIENAQTMGVPEGWEKFSDANIELVFELCASLADTPQGQQALVGELMGFDPSIGFYARINNILSRRETITPEFCPELMTILDSTSSSASLHEREDLVGLFLVQNHNRLSALVQNNHLPINFIENLADFMVRYLLDLSKPKGKEALLKHRIKHY